MLRMETVAERMADRIVGHHPMMPGVGKTAQTVNSTRCLEDTAHATIMTVALCLLNGPRPVGRRRNDQRFGKEVTLRTWPLFQVSGDCVPPVPGAPSIIYIYAN
jgi:hypothetical protein